MRAKRRSFFYHRNYNMKNDCEFLRSACEQIENVYVKRRLINRLEWYMVTSNRCSALHYLTSCIGMLMPTIILTLNSAAPGVMPENLRQFYITLLSGICSISCGLAGIFDWHNNMIRYRTCAERLKSETSFYLQGINQYGNKKTRDQMFLLMLESISLSDNQAWEKGEASQKEDK